MHIESIIATTLIDSTSIAAACSKLESAMEAGKAIEVLYKESEDSHLESKEYLPDDSEEQTTRSWSDPNRMTPARIAGRKHKREKQRVTVFAGRLRLNGAIAAIEKARNELITEIEKLRLEIDSFVEAKSPWDAASAKINTIFANRLCYRADELQSKLRSSLRFSSVQPQVLRVAGQETDLAKALNAAYESDLREWVVMYSGHGSAFRYDEGDGSSVPSGPHLSYDEACRQASDWIGYADTIGGNAQLYNVRTGETVTSFIHPNYT